jgi:hypothetical protein
MKRKQLFSLVLLFAALSATWSHATESEMVEIQCKIKPIARSKIHPHGKRSNLQSPSTSPTTQTTSTNWSGYVAGTDLNGTSGNGTVDYVAGSWVVPTLKATADDTYCAIWVGIDGYNSGSVEQIGTSHDWFNGAQQNYAWFEMYPSGSFEINGFPVNNGDVISARVGYKGDGVFKLVIMNHTQNVSTTIPTAYTTSTSALRSCAEWIVEAPYSGAILPLSDFQTVTLNYCSAVINGVSGLINNGAWMNDEITLADSSGTIQAQPTVLLKDGSCFQVAWKSED